MTTLIESKQNMLEAPAIALMPVIGDVLMAIRATQGCRLARMSGSGATCFGLYSNAAEAQQGRRKPILNEITQPGFANPRYHSIIW